LTRYLVTGATGSIGSALTRKLLESKENFVDAFDNNEYGLAVLESELATENLKIIIGDIRDRYRLELLVASKPYDAIIHLAALKRVEAAEENVAEAIKTNVLGTINVIEACERAPPGKFLLISSDKAVPVNEIGVYGATKFLQERIVLSCKAMRCAVARFGNVKGTRGDVFEIWKKQATEGKPLTLTDPQARRFYWEMHEAINFIVMCLSIMQGGEIFIPEMKEYNMLQMFRMTFPKEDYIAIGLRPGEVLLHELMTQSERLRAERTLWGWIIR